MNTRIKELAMQAGFDRMGIARVIGIEEYHQNFAELILQECVQQLIQESNRLYVLAEEETDQNSADSFAICAKKCECNAIMIKTHFGIKL